MYFSDLFPNSTKQPAWHQKSYEITLSGFYIYVKRSSGILVYSKAWSPSLVWIKDRPTTDVLLMLIKYWISNQLTLVLILYNVHFLKWLNIKENTKLFIYEELC